MEDINPTAERLVDQAERFATFTGITEPNPDDRFFLVMGETGSGKSTFISRCTGKDVATSDSLYSHTASIDLFDYEMNGRRIYLIDTPGFNDTNRSDSETLQILAAYLGASYANGVRIHGVIILHSITDNRVAGSDIRNFQIIKAMCGFHSYANLLIATTMWPSDLVHNDKAFLLNREISLKSNDKYFGWFMGKGAAMARHNENGHRDVGKEANSARHIVNHLIEQAETHPPEPLLLQRELIDEGKSLADTTAGFAINAKLYKARADHERQLREIEAEMMKELAQEDPEHAAELREVKEEVEWRLAEAIEDKKALEKTMQEMHEKEERYWKERISAMEKQFRRRLEIKEQELLEMEESLSEIRKDITRRSKSERSDRELGKYEDALNNARGELDQARHVYQRFSGSSASRDEEMRKGTVNGVASGVMSGLITSAATAATTAGMCTIM